MGTVVALAGQIGGAKLAQGLAQLRGNKLAVIVNTGDDSEDLGLSVSPDVDTMLFILAGIADPRNSWEIAGDTFAFQDMLKHLGGPLRGHTGDRARALQALRAHALRNEQRLTQITLGFCKSLGIEPRVLPMSDDPVHTRLITEAGEMSYTEYFEDLGCEPVIREFFYAGAADARVSDEVMEALFAPDLEAIVICPANPYHTIRPILEVGNLREVIKSRGVPIVAVSPMAGGQAHRGSAAKMMRELGHEVSSRSIALEYYQLIDGFVIDTTDGPLADGLRASGFEILATKTFMEDAADREALAGQVLDFATGIRERRLREIEA